jgi:putative heme iron utilization protein
MTPDPDFDPAAVAKGLLRRSRQGALATLMAGSGDPYCSLVNVATAPDGAPLLLVSRLAVHTRNLLADPRVSLMLDERRAGDPLEGSRIMISARAEPAGPDTLPVWRRRYLAAQPEAEAFADFTDFGFHALRIERVHLVAGFGRIVDLAPDQVLTDLTDAEALVEAEPEIIAHMNADHRDALGLYATCLLGGAPADWICSGCDPEGLDLQAGRAALRLTFPRRLLGPGALRAVLKETAERLRATG